MQTMGAILLPEIKSRGHYFGDNTRNIVQTACTVCKKVQLAAAFNNTRKQ